MTRAVVRPRPPLVTGLLLALLLAVAGCTAGSAHPDRPAVAPSRLDASVTQFRFDEGTRRLKAGVTNNGEGDIRVTRATIDWDGLAFPTLALPDEAIHPGQTAAFTIAYGTPRCSRPPGGTPVLVAVVDSRSRRLPLRVQDPGLLRRLWIKACDQQRLARAASVVLRLKATTVRVAGQEFLPGDVVLRHRAGARDRVRVVDLGGSVLLDLLPRNGRHMLPATLPPNRRELAFPLLLGSAHRCDAHALGQSSQTFLISAYVRLDGRPTQRVILPLTRAERGRAIGVVHRDCR